MKKLSLIITTVLFSFGVLTVSAQGGGDSETASHDVSIEIPQVALVDIEASDGEASTINLTPVVDALEAGEAIDFGTATDNSLWLNYTSIVKEDQTRNVTVELSSGTLPGGVSLKLKAGAINSGKGEKGSPTGELELDNTAKELITGIGSCYTENGFEKGHQLTYTLDMNSDEYEELLSDDYSVSVTYTITGE